MNGTRARNWKRTMGRRPSETLREQTGKVIQGYRTKKKYYFICVETEINTAFDPRQIQRLNLVHLLLALCVDLSAEVSTCLHIQQEDVCHVSSRSPSHEMRHVLRLATA